MFANQQNNISNMIIYHSLMLCCVCDYILLEEISHGHGKYPNRKDRGMNRTQIKPQPSG